MKQTNNARYFFSGNSICSTALGIVTTKSTQESKETSRGRERKWKSKQRKCNVKESIRPTVSKENSVDWGSAIKLFNVQLTPGAVQDCQQQVLVGAVGGDAKQIQLPLSL